MKDSYRSRQRPGRRAAPGQAPAGRAPQAPGRPLDPPLRAWADSSFGHDFSRVRVHTGAEAAHAAQSLEAAAYTSGDQVVFADQHYRPDTTAGMMLLAHELAHVVQFAHGDHPPSHSPPELTAPGDAAEREASNAAAEVVLGGSAGPLANAPDASLAREEESWWQKAAGIGGAVGDIVGLGGNVAQGVIQGNIPNLLGAFGASPTLGASADLAKGLGPGFNVLGGATGLLGAVTGTATALDSSKSAGERIMGGASGASGTIGFLGSIFPGLAAGGSSGLGATALGSGAMGSAGAFGTAGAALGSGGAVLGSGLAGWTIGRLGDEAFGGLMNATGASDWLDERQGIGRAEGQHGDYSISGLMAEGMLRADQGISSLWRDESKPEYSQTIGWKLGELGDRIGQWWDS